jgi:hypothetical protein
MSYFYTTVSVFGAVLLGAVIVIFRNSAGDKSVDDGKPLPNPALVPEDASPLLVSSSPLPATDRQYVAKPVIAADHEHRTVVAQDVVPPPQVPVRLPVSSMAISTGRKMVVRFDALEELASRGAVCR